MLRGKTNELQRKTNQSLVLSTIRHNQGISRIQVASILGLNKSTITYIVAELLEQGVLRSTISTQSRKKGGRRPIHIEINPNFGCILGIELQAHTFRFVIQNFCGTVLYSDTLEFPLDLTTVEGKFDYAFQIAEKAADSIGLPLIGVGVGIPGQVNPHTGEILESYSLKIQNYHFFKNIASRYKIPIIIENDANSCAAGELFANSGSGPKNFLYILTKYHTHYNDYRETGVGAVGFGIVIDNKLYYGESNLAGEFRSVYWNSNTLEQVGIESEELVKITMDRDVLVKFIRELCLNLSVIISVINPGRIYIGGDLRKDFDLIDSIIKKEFSHAYVAHKNNGCEIVPADYNEYDVAAGAGFMFLEQLFAPPEVKRIEMYYSLDWDNVFTRFKTFLPREATP